MFYKILPVAGMALQRKQKYSEAEKGTEDPTQMLTMEHSSFLLPQQQGQKSLLFTL